MPMRKLLPMVVFLTVSVLGIAGAVFVWAANERTERINFQAAVDEAISRIQVRFSQHMTLLDATTAFLQANGPEVTPERFRSFVANLSLDWQYPGLLALGFAPLLPADEVEAAGATVARDAGGPVPIRPAGGQRWRAPVVLLEPPMHEEAAALGFDLYADQARREAMEKVARDGLRHASRALLAAEEGNIAPKPYFVVFSPVNVPTLGTSPGANGADRPTGFAFASFRVEDLFRKTVESRPALLLHIVAREADAPEGDPIFVSDQPPSTGGARDLRTTTVLDIAGRDWLVTFRPAIGFERASTQGAALLLGSLALICGAALAALFLAEAREAAATSRLAEATRRNLAERELMLREMQHRIKNSITRILAMARQTAATAPDLESFSATFTDRLQAMASAQDMLTGSRCQSAELSALVHRELAQALGREPDPGAVTGPDIRLNERATQALGLTFHELATNALKYQGGPEAAGSVRIAWGLEPSPAGERLVIDWTESGAGDLKPPGQTGFGTKLIDASIRMELGGAVERDWRPGGLALRIVVPAAKALSEELR
jgi:CHASE1-domain containing sensor protein/two-component sensor histidine kinase